MVSGSASALRSLAGRVHPAARARLRRLATPSPVPGAGLLSVVVPMYNVAPYLERCLTSLVSQSYRQLEILLVDDGSTDATAAIAAGYARRDRRVKLLTLPHAGNGRARNAGIAAATGRYLAFADADDVVPAGAYAAMVESLARTGSDFCVGSYGRIRGSKRTPVRLADRLHARHRPGISLADCPEIIDDVFLWNKVFLRSFWNTSVGDMPEGIRYEDQETTARAYLRARSFDVLANLVYWWRIREDNSSITQAKHLLEDLEDRLTVAADVTALFRAEGTAAVQEHWYRRLLGSDLVPYIEQVPDASEEFWQRLRDGVGELYAAGRPYLARIDPQSRVLLHLAAGGQREDIRRAVVDRINNGTASPLEFLEGRIAARPPLLAVLETPVPQDLLEVLPEQLELVTDLRRQAAASGTGESGPGESVTLHGHAYLRNVDLRSNQLTLEVLTTGGNGLPVRRRSDPDIDVLSGDRNCSYADSAFAVELPMPLSAHVVLRAGVAGHWMERTVPVPAGADTAATGAVPGNPTVTRFAARPGETGDELEIAVAGAPAGASFALATARYRLPAESTRLPGGAVRLRIPLAGRRWGAVLPAPPSGSYTLRWRVGAGEAGPGDPAVAVPADVPASNTSALLPNVRVRSLRTAAGMMAVSIGAPLRDDETGTFHQYRLRRAALDPAATAELEPGVFFESFGGKSCTDSPRAISDYLAGAGFEEPLYWSVADRSVPVPEYAVPLLQGSAEWYRRLATTRRLVNNNNFPWYFRKAPGQFYLQTWHGTPLKKIGLDIPQHLLSLSYRDLMAREARWWDLLLAQNDFAAGVLPKALGYKGEVLTAGYPRNDALLAPDASDTRDRVRTLLGLAPHHKVLLYAPTWRDAVRDGAGRSDWAGFLDVAEASRRLGPDYRFLIRGHHNVAGQRRIDAHPAAIDVTEYPEVNDLYLASDALVTDYSSAVFDYAVLDRPIHLLVPDLAEYRRTRGLYLEPGAEPGRLPVVSTTAELVAALRPAPTASMLPAPVPAMSFAPVNRGACAAAAAQALLAGAHARLKNATGDRRG